MCFLINKIFDDEKILFIYDRFFVPNRTFTTKHDNIV